MAVFVAPDTSGPVSTAASSEYSMMSMSQPTKPWLWPWIPSAVASQRPPKRASTETMWCIGRAPAPSAEPI
jgi:hypothetical protein